MKTKKVKAPKGFRLIVRKNWCNYYEVALYRTYVSGSKKIGTVELHREHHKTYSTHSNLDQQWWGKGLGALMYAKAIEWGIGKGYKIRSSGYSSEYAQRVWKGKTIRKYFDIKDRPTYKGSESLTWFASAKKPVKKKKR